MIKFACYITLSFTLCLPINLMAQDIDSKQSSSHQITAAGSQKSADAKSPNDENKSKPVSENRQSSEKDEIDWTKVVATIIAGFSLVFGIYQYIRRQQDKKKKRPQNSKPKMSTGYEKNTTLPKRMKTYISIP